MGTCSSPSWRTFLPVQRPILTSTAMTFLTHQPCVCISLSRTHSTAILGGFGDAAFIGQLWVPAWPRRQ